MFGPSRSAKFCIVLSLSLTVALAGACSDDSGSTPDGGAVDSRAGDSGTSNTVFPVSSTTLTNVSGTPSATGKVSIVETVDGKRMLQLGADFAQDMGPGDTELRLAADSTNIKDQLAADAANVSDSLGNIPNGGSGARSFEIPSNVDLSKLKHVVIWCPTAAVNFGTGQLADSAAKRFGATLSNVSGTPSASGSVSIREKADGGLALVLGSDFSQEMGPGDTEVRLAKSDKNVKEQTDADASNVSPSLAIVGNGGSGQMVFDVPAGVDPSTFSHVIIWCPTAAVNFAVGSLSAN